MLFDNLRLKFSGAVARNGNFHLSRVCSKLLSMMNRLCGLKRAVIYSDRSSKFSRLLRLIFFKQAHSSKFSRMNTYFWKNCCLIFFTISVSARRAESSPSVFPPEYRRSRKRKSFSRRFFLRRESPSADRKGRLRRSPLYRTSGKR